jgi:uncharacterized membrane protein
MRPWELHPVLIHFPIAFLLGGMLVDLIARIRPRESLTRVASGLLLAGVLSGIAAAFAGVVSYYTVPAHTEAAHGQMDAHLILASAALALFALVTFARWRRRTQPASAMALSGGLVATALLVGAAFLGGKVVYQGGAGVDPRILAPVVVEGHHHHHHDGDEPADTHDDDDHEHAHAAAAQKDESAAHQHQHAEAAAADHDHDHARVARNTHDHAPLFDPDEDLRQPLR